MTELLPPLPRLDPSFQPAEIIGLGALFKLIRGTGLRATLEIVAAQALRHPEHAGIKIDLATLHFMLGREWEARASEIRREGLDRQRVYRVVGDSGTPVAPRLRLLAFVSGDAPRSTLPIDFILNGSEVRLDLLYVFPGEPLPMTVPNHDVAMVTVGESERNQETLRWLAPLVARWPRPVVNDPARIAVLARHRVPALLAGVNGLAIPPTARITGEEAASLGAETAGLEKFLPKAAFPLLIRPVSSHSGRDLRKLGSPAEIPAYLAECDAAAFYLSRFVDYRSADGLYRKYRIVFIGGRPFLCHLAISADWMIHYVTAGMEQSAEKRAEEAKVMADFDRDFAVRHRESFAALCARVGLDYFGLDCGETGDGRLLVFEVETALGIHALDPVDLFPYKQGAMRRTFAAFVGLLADAARGAVRPKTAVTQRA